MTLKNYQLAWGILLVFCGCMADSTTPSLECVENQAGECADKKDVYNIEKESYCNSSVSIKRFTM